MGADAVVRNDFIKEFWRIMIVVITAGIYLTACGSRDGEELAQIGQKPLNDDIEAKITRSDITWDDYNSGNERKTCLHFSFSDGTIVDKELPYNPSMIQKVDFADITGDGKDEILIYRYFANTATEYTLVNFFQIEGNIVTEISPELELEELGIMYGV